MRTLRSTQWEHTPNFETRRQPWFDASSFNGFNQAIPMKTMVIYCVDPRAADVPDVVARHFGDEVYPGENILDDAGNRIGNTRTLFTVTNGGGRAASALMTVAEMDYLFNVDISTLFDRESVAITDFERSLKYDVELLRRSPAVPKHVNLYGFFYEINSGKLIEVVKDIGLPSLR